MSDYTSTRDQAGDPDTRVTLRDLDDQVIHEGDRWSAWDYIDIHGLMPWAYEWQESRSAPGVGYA